MYVIRLVFGISLGLGLPAQVPGLAGNGKVFALFYEPVLGHVQVVQVDEVLQDGVQLAGMVAAQLGQGLKSHFPDQLVFFSQFGVAALPELAFQQVDLKKQFQACRGGCRNSDTNRKRPGFTVSPVSSLNSLTRHSCTVSPKATPPPGGDHKLYLPAIWRWYTSKIFLSCRQMPQARTRSWPA